MRKQGRKVGFSDWQALHHNKLQQTPNLFKSKVTITILPCLHNTDLKVPTRALRQEKTNTYSVRICYKSSKKNKLNCHSFLAVNITVDLKTQQILYGDNYCMLITIF